MLSRKPEHENSRIKRRNSEGEWNVSIEWELEWAAYGLKYLALHKKKDCQEKKGSKGKMFNCGCMIVCVDVPVWIFFSVYISMYFYMCVCIFLLYF